MKISTLSNFQNYLNGSPASNLYFILGKESFDRKTATDFVVSALLKEKNDLSVQTYEGEKFDVDALLEDLNSFSLFEKQRIIILQNIDKLTKSTTEKLEVYFANLNPMVYLVISGITINHATNFYKKGEKAGVVLEIAEEKSWEKERSMGEWIQAQVSAMGKKIHPQATQYLLKQVGTDRSLIHQELQKLLCYIDNRAEITQQDVCAVSISMNVENAWQLAEAIFKRDAASALRISRALLDDGVALIALLRQIRSQIQTEYQICSILSTGGNSSEVSQQFPYMRGQILEKHLQMSQNYGMGRFKKAMLKIDEIELLAKNSQLSPEFLAEILITKLTV